MDVKPYLELLLRQRRLVAGITVLVAALAYAFSYAFTPQYVAKTSVLLRPTASRILSDSGTPVSSQPSSVSINSAASIAQTHADLVSSRAVAVAVVDDLKLDQLPQDPSLPARARRSVKYAWNVVKDVVVHGSYVQPSPREAAISEVMNNTKGTAVSDSYLIDVQATADDPKLAAKIADTAAADLIKVSANRAKTDAKANAAFLKTQVDRARSDLEAADTALVTYQQSNGLTDASAASGLHLTATSQQSLSDQLRQVGVDLAGAQAQEKALEDQIAQNASTTDATSTVANGRSSTTVTNVEPSTIYQNLVTSRGALDAQIAALQAKQDALTQLLTPSSGLQPAQEAQLRDLENQETAATTAYQALSGSYQQALVNSQDDGVELSQADVASVPLYPTRPVRYLFGLIGLLAGFVVAMLAAYIVERRGFDRAPWSPRPELKPARELAPAEAPEGA